MELCCQQVYSLPEFGKKESDQKRSKNVVSREMGWNDKGTVDNKNCHWFHKKIQKQAQVIMSGIIVQEKMFQDILFNLRIIWAK